MKVFSQVSLAALCAALVVPAVQADDAGGFYLGAEVLSTDFSGPGPGSSSNFAPGQSFGDKDSGYGLHVGYNFTEWFAIELGATDFGSATDTFKLKDGIIYIVQPNDTQTLEAKSLSLTGVFTKRLGSDWSVFGLLGISSMDYKSTLSGGFSEQTGSLLVRDSYDDQGLIYGVGAAYKLSDALSLRIDLRRNDVGDFTLDSLGLGVDYQF